MADGIGFKMFTGPFHKAIGERQVLMPKAAMFAVREAGRVTQRAARQATPVLKGAPSHKNLQRYRKQLGANVSGAYGRPVAGLLKASITPSRALKRSGPSSVSLKVGPRGARAHLYAQKIERRVGNMAAGERAAKSAMPAIAQKAFDRVWKG